MSTNTKIELHPSVIISMIRLTFEDSKRGKTLDQIIRDIGGLIDPVRCFGYQSPIDTRPVECRSARVDPAAFRFGDPERSSQITVPVSPLPGTPGNGVPGPVAHAFRFGDPMPNPFWWLGPKRSVAEPAPTGSGVGVEKRVIDHSDEPPAKQSPWSSGPEFQTHRCGYIHTQGKRAGQICFGCHGDHPIDDRMIKTVEGKPQYVCGIHRNLLLNNPNVRDSWFHPETLIKGVNCDHSRDGWALRQPGVEK